MPLSKFYSSPRAVKGEGDQQQIEDIFEMMEKGDDMIKLDPKHKDPIFVLGNTGSGKSSLILFVGTDNTTLRSQETSEGSGDFFIVDDDDKIGSGINSQTDVPELIVDKETQSAFYDCPGFNDTRTSINEIATSYFIKRIFDFADEIKIVLTVIHASVRVGMERTDFMNLLRNATTLIKDVDKYESSICLVVTKVENTTEKVPGGGYRLVPDENIIKAIEKFLEQTKDNIKDRLKLVQGDVKEETFLKKSLNLIDKFLVKNSAGKYAKIGLFRRPDEAGPLLDVELLQERKPDMIQLIHKTLNFTKKNKDDIGYTISDTAKLVINKIVEKLRDHVSVEVDKVIEVFGQHHQSLTDQIYKTFDSFGRDRDAGAEVAIAKGLVTKRDASFTAIHKLKADVVNATKIEDIAEAVRVCGTTVDLDTTASVASLNQQNRYFEFLKTFNESLSIGDYSKKFDGILITVAVKIDVNKTVEKVKNLASEDTDKVASALIKNYQNIAEQIQAILNSFEESNNADVDPDRAKDLHTKFNSIHDPLKKLTSDVAAAKAFNEIAKAIEVCTSVVEINSEASVTNLRQQDIYFKFLQTFNKEVIIGDYSRNFDGILAPYTTTKTDIENRTENMATKFRERITNHLNEIAKEISTHYTDKIEAMEIQKLIDELTEQNKIMTEFTEASKNIKSVQLLSKNITDMVSKLDINTTETNTGPLDVLVLGNYLTVLIIFKKEIIVWSPDWIKPFTAHADEVFTAGKWYTFLQGLYTKFSTYKIQQFKKRYNVADIDDWGKDGKSQGIEITKKTYTKFLEKINETNETIKKMDFDDKKSKELNHVLDVTLRRAVTSSKKTVNEVLIQATFVKLSDILDSNGKITSEFSYGETINILNVHVTDTIFIDRNLIAVGEKLQVNIVATHWEVIGNVSINLSGADGASQDTAGGGSYPAGGGDDGKPGLAGGAGGNFLGIGYEFTAIGNLTITANGGRGGKGQKGGTGGTGKDGANAERSDDFSSDVLEKTDSGMVAHIHYRFNGKDGRTGGVGGDGGVGGLGGLAGNIKTIRLDGNSDLPVQKLNEGPVGEGGDGGEGGTGGKRGNDLYIWCTVTLWTSWKTPGETRSRSERAARGNSGKSNSNSSGRKKPDGRIDLVNIGDVTNDFESYLRTFLHDPFQQKAIKNFIDQLNHKTREIYETATLANSLTSLESKVVQLNNKLTNDEIIYLYQSIVKRTAEYAKKPKDAENTNEYKKALKYIQTAALCKIQTRKNAFPPNLIIDVAGNIDLILRNVGTLKNLNRKRNKSEIIDEQKETFKNNINKKIAEAQRFIEDEIVPEIGNISKALDKEVDKLIDEVLDLQEAAEKEKDKLIAKKRMLELGLGFNILCSGFKLFGGFLGPVGTVGAVATSIVDTVLVPPRPPPTPMFYVDSETQTETVQKEIKDAKEEIKKAKSKMPDPKILTDLTTRYAGDKGKMNVIDAAIRAQEEKLAALKKFEKSIYDTMVPLLDGAEKMLDDVSAQLETKSQVALDVSNWNVQKTLRDIKLQMNQATTGYKVNADIQRCIEKLEETMNVQINLYDRIQSYQDQQVLASFIADVSSGLDETNPQLTHTLDSLEIIIRSNLVLDQHKQAVNALAQNVFPFADLYLNKDILLFNPKTDEGLDDVVKQAVDQLETMKSEIEKYKTTIQKQDIFITNSDFNSEFHSTQPFYVWSKANHKPSISKLLAGEKITLYTDVRRANLTNMYAIKFNLTEINFKAENEKKQSDLKQLLKNFSVYLTHLGNSYYRFKERIYIIHSESQTIYFTFERKRDETPIKTNGVYEKIKNGDLMLSPFAMWQIQLSNEIKGDVDHWKELQKYDGQVDLELIGHGNYVSEYVEIPDLNVENYYHEDTVTFAGNNQK